MGETRDGERNPDGYMILVRKSRKETSRSTWRRDRNDVLPEARLRSDVEGAHWAGKTMCPPGSISLPPLVPSLLASSGSLATALRRRFFLFYLSSCLVGLPETPCPRLAGPAGSDTRRGRPTSPQLHCSQPPKSPSLSTLRTNTKRKATEQESKKKINDQQKREERAWTRIRGD